MKQQITLRLDADVVNWFKEQAPDGRGYQTKINRALREYVMQRPCRAAWLGPTCDGRASRIRSGRQYPLGETM